MKKHVKKYRRDVVFRSQFTGQYYFAPKVEVMFDGWGRVVGRKVDVTASIHALFGPMLERERKRLGRIKRKKKS